MENVLTKCTFSHFFHHVKIALSGIPLTNLVIGSDDDKAMVIAISIVMPELTKQERDEIINDIFGQDGLISADDTICYNDKCSTLETKLSAISTTFRNYFTTRLRPILKKKVCDPVREKVIEKESTNNNSERMNHVLK
ncbi:hypothetical protein DPMN_128453 [Dreissena polymorpha]|uniref:Uncharacterized protein n=1 Tax=Dreissena polymorpha TaxID=45954 RepID=A0A9D4HUD2_DREPO|nr:hypothetical protein DPMN_057268 [Dreissena polymorpha]KAH3826547.1 hypothetical protein DPMN_128453 [Dreissena polymorpha]